MSRPIPLVEATGNENVIYLTTGEPTTLPDVLDDSARSAYSFGDRSGGTIVSVV